MAIDATSSRTEPVSSNVSVNDTLQKVTDIARAILAPLASLKLTVFLLVLATLVIFIGTLEQTRLDINSVKHKYFLAGNVFVPVSVETFLVPRWFPNLQSVPSDYRFYVPSGMTLLVMMLINLSAAHVLRFRLQATGVRLITGLVIAAIAGVVTWAVIFNSQNPEGLQGTPPIPWKTMWVALQIVVLAITCWSALGFFTIKSSRVTERILLATGAVVGGGLLLMTLLMGSDAFIGDSAMRILWQLAQATMAAGVAMLASWLLFKRKAGIVLLHLGIAGLMFNEIYVNVTNEESRMTIFEGETVCVAQDIRSTELAIVNTSDPEFDEIVTVPGNKLISGQTIKDDRLPFSVTCIEYIKNSELSRVDDPSSNLATQGIGRKIAAKELLITTGTDVDQTVDISSAYVSLADETGKQLGTYLVSQQMTNLENADSVEVDGKTYQIALRFKTIYKPVSVELVDVEAKYYLSTDTPREFSSEVKINDNRNGATFDHNIWMNNPLRYSGETYYQSGYNRLPDGREYTVLQVVKNRGWMIPYVCCMFTVLGLVSQFGTSLLSFLDKNRKQVAKAELVALKNSESGLLGTTAQKRRTGWVGWLPTFVLVGFFAIYGVGQLTKATSPTVTQEGFRLDLFGQIPVSKNGRVQPLDSFARNTARQLNKRETIKDGNEQKQPAIAWLADTIFDAPGYLDYRLFRIEDQDVLNTLELPQKFEDPERKDLFRYSLDEVLAAEPKLMELVAETKDVDKKQWTRLQARLYTLATKIQQVNGARMTFGGDESFRSSGNLFVQLERFGRHVASPLVPLVVPNPGNLETPWKSAIVTENQAWLADLAQKHDANTTGELASKILKEEVFPTLRKDAIKEEVINQLLSDPEFIKVLKEQHGETDPKQFALLLESTWDQLPAEIYDSLVSRVGPEVDAMLEDKRPQYEQVMADQIAKINGGSATLAVQEPSEFESLLMTLGPAYRAGDATTFNKNLEKYLAAVNATPPAEMKPIGIKVEKIYNGFSPFFFSMVVYLVAALVATLGWIGWSKPWNRAAMSLLILGLIVHIGGLVARVVISGRPPVTNLYSSALFVSAVFVVAMLVVERFTKLGIGNILAGVGAFAALAWAWSMSIVDGDTFAVLVAVLDTQFWLTTHVICISIGYGATFAAGFVGLAYVIAGLLTPALNKETRRDLSNAIYGLAAFGLLTSFFGTVLGGLWGDDSWGRFWGWDPKENGAMMIVLWNAVVLHSRWGGIVRERGLAALTIVGSIITIWSWKGVNALGVGLHAYAGTEDQTIQIILYVVYGHLLVLALALIPLKYWMSYAQE